MTNAGKVPTPESTARSATRLRPPHAQGAKRASMLGGRRRPSAKRAGRRWGAPLLLWVAAAPPFCTLSCTHPPSTPIAEPSDVEIVVDGVASAAKSGEPFYVTADDRHVVTVRRGEQSTDLELIVGAGKSHEARVVLEEKKARRLWPVIGIGAGVTAIAAGIGIGLTMGAKDAQRQVEATQPLIKSPCAKPPAVGPCKDLADAASRHDAMAGGAIGLFVVAGVVGAAGATLRVWNAFVGAARPSLKATVGAPFSLPSDVTSLICTSTTRRCKSISRIFALTSKT